MKRIGPIVASLLVAGGGHFVLGRWLRGLVWQLAVGVCVTTAVFSAASGVIALWWIALTLLVPIEIAAIVDATRLSRDHASVRVGWLVFLAAFVLTKAELAWYRSSVAEAFLMPSGSMIPALQVGDHFYVDKRVRQPERGDVIAFRYPREPEKTFVKRVLAVGGDTIEWRDGQPILNGAPIPSRDLGDCTYFDHDDTLKRWQEHLCRATEETLDGKTYRIVHDLRGFPSTILPVIVPTDSYYVIGDNRDNSHDSRVWGFVPADHVLGRFSAIWWHGGPPPSEK